MVTAVNLSGLEIVSGNQVFERKVRNLNAKSEIWMCVFSFRLWVDTPLHAYSLYWGISKDQ